MASYLWKKLLSNSTFSAKKITQNPLPLNRNHWWSKTNNTKNDKTVRPGHYVVTKQIHPDIFPRQVILPPYAITGIPPPISNSMVSLLHSKIHILDKLYVFRTFVFSNEYFCHNLFHRNPKSNLMMK